MTEKRGTPMRRWRPRAFAAAALAAILALTASGCSLLIPQPPDVVSITVDQAVAELRSTTGVASVTSSISPYDVMDGGPLSNPKAWHARITVEAQPDAADLPVLADAVAQRIEEVHGLMQVDATLHLSVGARGVDTTIGLPVDGGRSDATPAGQLIATAEQLASIDSVSSIGLGSRNDNGATVGVTAPADLPAVAASIRHVPAFGAGELAAVAVSVSAGDAQHLSARVTMDAASPSPELLTLIARLADEPGVASVYFGGVQPAAGQPVGPDAAGWRPTLSVAVDDEATQTSVVAALEAFAGPQAIDATVPRASFEVARIPEQAPRVYIDGFIGLPVGSPAPDDGRKPTPLSVQTPAPPTPETPEQQAARVESDKVAIAQLLDAAGDLAGIRGTPTIQTIACQAGGIDSGQQVTGSVVIPIFEVADTADDAYAAITNSWKAAGLGSVGSAMGRAYFGTSSPDASVQQASIRGTSDGLSITAQGRC